MANSQTNVSDEISPRGPTIEPAAISRAIEAFVHGFGFTRSFTHPYLAERVGPLWVMRDAPRKKGDYRSEEWVAYGVAPEEVDRIARQQTRGRFALCVICGLDEPHAPQVAGYKALGYRLGTTEPLMTHSLDQIPLFDSPARVERVLTPDLAQRLAKAAGARQLLPEHLSADAPLRQYVAWVDGELVGWVRSIVVGDATWCSNMYVRPEFRRRGIARAMLSRMLHDDCAGCAQTAVLLASHTGAKLYPVVGYEQIGTLLLFTPKKR
jgi:GNAT superfamily N-acetyltransferase